MKKVKKTMLLTSVAILLILVIALFFPTWTPSIPGDNSISVLEQVEINGSRHEVMIRGKEENNPVILFVHGGPGCSEIPYARKYQDALENKFTVVNYDQRASGKSYHFGEDYSDLSSDLLVKDLLAMTDYISERLGIEKVILIGHSYGTYLGMQAAYRAPDKYEAYIGIGQMSDTVESEIDSLNYAIGQAQAAGHTEDVASLQELTEQITNGEAFTPRDQVMKYGGASRLIDNPDGDMIGMLFSTEYNLLDAIRYNLGVSYSQSTLVKEVLKKPLSSIVTKLDIPFYFVMGDYDYQTSSHAARTYFDRIEADHKAFIAFEHSAHYPQFEEKDRFYQWMCDTFIQ